MFCSRARANRRSSPRNTHTSTQHGYVTATSGSNTALTCSKPPASAACTLGPRDARDSIFLGDPLTPFIRGVITGTMSRLLGVDDVLDGFGCPSAPPRKPSDIGAIPRYLNNSAGRGRGRLGAMSMSYALQILVAYSVAAGVEVRARQLKSDPQERCTHEVIAACALRHINDHIWSTAPEA